MVFYSLVLHICLKNGQKKEEKVKKQKKKRDSATIMIPVDGKGAGFLVKLKLQGESFEQRY